MALLGIDLGATKLASAVFNKNGALIHRENAMLNKREGSAVGKMITDLILRLLDLQERDGDRIISVGISVPGISYQETGKVWAPNIQGWIDYPLMTEVKKVTADIPVVIDSDRACYIMGEAWQGSARGCSDAVYLSIGTGIGAGIIVNSQVLRGRHDIAGAIGWMALSRPFRDKYIECGCFEYHASGAGIARVTRELLNEDANYKGVLREKEPGKITSHDLFLAYSDGDPLARRIIDECIGFWGMAVANLVSLFNPEKIIFGGGVFGPASELLPEILKEAGKWAQPIAIKQVSLEISGLGGDAGVYGAAYLALKKLN